MASLSASTAPSEGRVPKDTFQALIWLFYSIAIVTAAIRMVVRLHAQRLLQLDDVFLIFACICLTGATSVLNWGIPTVFQVLQLSIDPLHAELPTDLNALMVRFQEILFAYIPLTWATIFAAKFAYLCFFRRLIDRVRPLVIYWRVVIILTAVVAVLCILQAPVSCPYMDSRAVMCGQGAGYTKSFHLSIAGMTLDVVTDIMIVSIPVCLLWKVNLRPAQKLGLACFLCLSIVMAIMAIVRVSGLRITSFIGSPAFDTAWQYLWQQIEASIAVSLVSLTAFRQLFISHGSRQDRGPAKSWYSSTIEKLKSQRRRAEKGGLGTLPNIPSATLSGMRTWIHGSQRTDSSGSYDDDQEKPDSWPINQHKGTFSRHVRITNDITTEVYEAPKEAKSQRDHGSPV